MLSTQAGACLAWHPSPSFLRGGRATHRPLYSVLVHRLGALGFVLSRLLVLLVSRPLLWPVPFGARCSFVAVVYQKMLQTNWFEKYFQLFFVCSSRGFWGLLNVGCMCNYQPNFAYARLSVLTPLFGNEIVTLFWRFYGVDLYLSCRLISIV